ncbi:MAG: protease complex subunit PrcB family protein [Caldilineaceae bacterium]
MQKSLAWGIILLLCAGLLACQPIVIPSAQPAAEEIPFETLSLNETGEGVKVMLVTNETQLLIVTSSDQVVGLQQMVSAEDFAQLHQVDYQSQAVIALFRGVQGSNGYQTIIQRVSREGDRLVVHAELWSPSPYYAATTALTYPYHLIKLAKADLPAQSVELVLASSLITPTPPAQ